MEYIAIDPARPKGLGDIAETLEMNAATCANIIKTLVTRRYLVKLDKQKGYLLGPMFHRLGAEGGHPKTLVSAARKQIATHETGR